MTEQIAYRQSEVCRMLGINRSTLWRWARAGKIQLVEIGGIKFVSGEKINELRGNGRGNANVQILRNIVQPDTRTTAEKFAQKQ